MTKGMFKSHVEGNATGGPREVPCLSFPMQTATSQGEVGGKGSYFLLLLQLSAVGAGGSTAFVHANLSVPVVKVRGPAASRGEWGDTGLLHPIAHRVMPNPNAGAP